jgi:hypothetical protein
MEHLVFTADVVVSNQWIKDNEQLLWIAAGLLILIGLRDKLFRR